MANSSIIHRDAIDFRLQRQWSSDISSPSGGFNNTGIFMGQYTQPCYTSSSTQDYMCTPRSHTALLFMHESAWQGQKFTFLWVKTQAFKKRRGNMTLWPFSNLSFVSSFILLVSLFLYRKDNLQAHKMSATSNADPINLLS